MHSYMLLNQRTLLLVLYGVGQQGLGPETLLNFRINALEVNEPTSQSLPHSLYKLCSFHPRCYMICLLVS